MFRKVDYSGVLMNYQKKPPQEMESGNCIVGGRRGLEAFFARNAYSHVGRLNHRDVVRAIAHRQNHVFADFTHNVDHLEL